MTTFTYLGSLHYVESILRKFSRIAKAFIDAVKGCSSLLRKESAQEMIRPAEDFSWVGLGLFLRDDKSRSRCGSDSVRSGTACDIVKIYQL